MVGVITPYQYDLEECIERVKEEEEDNILHLKPRKEEYKIFVYAERDKHNTGT